MREIFTNVHLHMTMDFDTGIFAHAPYLSNGEFAFSI
jgi:hypothetical protein